MESHVFFLNNAQCKTNSNLWRKYLFSETIPFQKQSHISFLKDLKILFRSYQVRGHLAAQIDPLGLNNMNPEQAKKMIIRSVTVDEKVGEHNILCKCHASLTFTS